MAPKKSSPTLISVINEFIKTGKRDILESKLTEIIHNELPKCDSIYESKPSQRKQVTDRHIIDENVRLLTKGVGNDVVTISLSCNVEILRSRGDAPNANNPTDLTKRFYSDYDKLTKRTYIPLYHRDTIIRILKDLMDKITENKLDLIVLACSIIRDIYDKY